jgi:hypothetical protein
MIATVLYRVAAVALVLFAAGHTAGFLGFRPASAAGSAVQESMNSVYFDLNGSTRSYAELYKGFGLTVTAYMLFSAFLAWHLGSLARTHSQSIGALAWVFATLQLICLILSIRFFFLVPVTFGGVIVICLVWAAWAVRSART